MLVLSRFRDESIIINGNIKVTVIEIRGDKVRLGIEAPKEIPVHREEIQKAINSSGRCGLAGADAELEHYQAPQDDQPLQQKMEDERDGVA